MKTMFSGENMIVCDDKVKVKKSSKANRVLSFGRGMNKSSICDRNANERDISGNEFGKTENCSDGNNKKIDVDGGDESASHNVDQSKSVKRKRSQNKSVIQIQKSSPLKKRLRSVNLAKVISTVSSSTDHTSSKPPPASLKDHTCTVCHKVFLRESDLPRHMKIHTGEVFKCEFCDKSYALKEQLTRHVRDRHWKLKVPGSKMKPQWRVRSKEKIQCKFCDKWLHRCSVVRHVRNVHLKDIVDTEVGENATGDSDKVTKNTVACAKVPVDSDNHLIEISEDVCTRKEFSDNECKSDFNRTTSRGKHGTDQVSKATKRAAASTKKLISKSERIAASITVASEDVDVGDEDLKTESRLWKCPVCGIVFIHISELKIHLTIHTGELPYKCRVCSANFDGREKFVEHSKLHQNRKESKVYHVCSICNKSFTRKSSYLTHTLLVHKRERKFQCDLCGKAYGDRKTLRLHHRRFHS